MAQRTDLFTDHEIAMARALPNVIPVLTASLPLSIIDSPVLSEVCLQRNLIESVTSKGITYKVIGLSKFLKGYNF